MEFIEVKVVGWDKYNPRKDRKNHTWFKFSNDFFNSQSMFSCTVSEQVLFISVLCMCSKKCSDTVSLNMEWCSKVCSDTVYNTHQIFKKLEQLKVIELCCSKPQPKEKKKKPEEDKMVPRNGCANEHMLPEKQAPTKEVQGHLSDDQLSIFFEDLYRDVFPRKQGKTRGLKKCKTDVKKSELKDFEIAIHNYSNYVEANDIKREFTKHFSTWVSEWRDWIDVEDKDEFDKWAEGFANE